LEKGEFLASTDIQSTIARLLYYTDWAIRGNTYEFISWLSQMFISCWFGVKLTAKYLFLLIENLGFYR
jgi:hypothetical protein